MLDVRRMRVLREVALRGSFSAAAESLSFTQSAVSQQIAALERETGTILVQRNARGVRLTEAGEALEDLAVGAARGPDHDGWIDVREVGHGELLEEGGLGSEQCARSRSSAQMKVPGGWYKMH